MVSPIPDLPPHGSRSFQKVVDVFLSGEGLPFARVLTAKRIERVFAKHGALFGANGVYTTAIMVWSFLSQHAGEPGRVPSTASPSARSRVADRAGGGHRLVGHGLRHGLGVLTVPRQRVGRECFTR